MTRAGRPQIYSEKMLHKARKYLHMKRPNNDEVVPTVEGLALYLKIHRATVYDWAGQETKREFSDILELILQKQGNILVNKGLSGVFQSPIVKVMLGKHGYSDKSEIDVTSGGKSIGPTPASQRIAEAAIDKFLNGSGKNDTTNPQGK